jgi:hypothetical protein
MSDGSVADHGSRLICHVTNVSDTMSAVNSGLKSDHSAEQNQAS